MNLRAITAITFTLCMSLFLISCLGKNSIQSVVSGIKSKSSEIGSITTNPLSFIEGKINLPGPIVYYKLSNLKEYLEKNEKIKEQIQDFKFENVDSELFLKRLAFISEYKVAQRNLEIRVNEEYKNTGINIYFLKKEFAPSKLRGACAYVGYGRVVLCDGDSLKRVIAAMVSREKFFQLAIYNTTLGRFPSKNKNEYDEKTLTVANAYIAGGFLSWIIAHEIGHVINDYEFVEQGNLLHFNGYGILSEREKAADQFAANVISESPFGSSIIGISLMEFMSANLSDFAGRSDELTSESREFLVNGSLPSEFNINIPDSLEARLLLRAASVTSFFVSGGNYDDGNYSDQILSSVSIDENPIEKYLKYLPYLVGFILLIVLINIFINNRKRY